MNNTGNRSDTKLFPWGTVVTYHNGEQVYLICESRAHAERCIDVWKAALKADDLCVEFPTATGFRNCSRTQDIVRMSVMNKELIEQLNRESIKNRKRLERMMDYPDDHDDDTE